MTPKHNKSVNVDKKLASVYFDMAHEHQKSSILLATPI